MFAAIAAGLSAAALAAGLFHRARAKKAQKALEEAAKVASKL